MLQETESQDGRSKGKYDQPDLETTGEPVFCTESVPCGDCIVSTNIVRKHPQGLLFQV